MLSYLDRSILDFERAWTTMTGPKDKEIEISLGLASDVYYERLRFLIKDSHARSYDPLTTRRLQLMLVNQSGIEGVG